MKSYKRSRRVQSKVLSSVADLIKKKVKDPRLEMATITGVKMSDDLRDAYIYFTVYSSASDRQKLQNEAMEGFKSASGFIRTMLAKQLNVRYMPSIRFFHDGSFDYGEKMNKLFNELE